MNYAKYIDTIIIDIKNYNIFVCPFSIWFSIPSFSYKADTNTPQLESLPEESELSLQFQTEQSAKIQLWSPKHRTASKSFLQTGAFYPSSPYHSVSMAAWYQLYNSGGISADDNEYHTEQQIGHKIDIHPWPVQSCTINRNPHKNRNNRANPKHQSINLTADISPSWINACNNGSEPMAGEYNKINKCHAPQFALVRISYAFTIKMHRYLFRQLMPQKQSHQYRQ